MRESTLTLGIALSVADGNTAACAIRWEAGSGVITKLNSTWSNDAPSGAHRRGRLDRDRHAVLVAGSFREALAEHGVHGGWPADYRSLNYQLRSTDLFVKNIACRPLSVSTNLLGVTAMRCAPPPAGDRRATWRATLPYR